MRMNEGGLSEYRDERFTQRNTNKGTEFYMSVI